MLDIALPGRYVHLSRLARFSLKANRDRCVRWTSDLDRDAGIADAVGRKAGIQPPAPHDLRRTWTGDLLEAGVDLATVQKMAGHASVSTTGRYDRRDHAVQLRAAGQLQVPYVLPEN